MNNESNGSNKELFQSAIGGMFKDGEERTVLQPDQKKRPQALLEELELALAVILVDVASSDQNFDQSEYVVISEGLKRLFGTPKDRVSRLVNQALQTLATLRGSSKYAEQLRDHLSEEERAYAFGIVEELIDADGKKNPFEIYLRNKLAAQLNVKIS